MGVWMNIRQGLAVVLLALLAAPQFVTAAQGRRDMVGATRQRIKQ
jgi:hypothetical protein